MRSRQWFFLPLVILLWAAPSGCDEPVVPTFGLNLGELFPQRADWFWKYNNDDFSEVSYWHNLGTTAPDGEDWLTFRLWVGAEQDIIDDIADGDPSDWDLQVYWVERADGWYLRGWEANPVGPSAALGTEYFDVDVPFALSNVTGGVSWTADAAGRSWTVTPTEVLEDLEFNGQNLQGVWKVEVSSDLGDTPLEGSWWLVGGPGLVQWDLPQWRAQDSTGPWQHMHNDSYDNVLGVDVR